MRKEYTYHNKEEKHGIVKLYLAGRIIKETISRNRHKREKYLQMKMMEKRMDP